MSDILPIKIGDTISYRDSKPYVVVLVAQDRNHRIYTSYVAVSKNDWWNHPVLKRWNFKESVGHCVFFAGGAPDRKRKSLSKPCLIVTNPCEGEITVIGQERLGISPRTMEALHKDLPVGHMVGLTHEHAPWQVAAHALFSQNRELGVMVGLEQGLDHKFMPLMETVRRIRPVKIKREVSATL